MSDAARPSQSDIETRTIIRNSSQSERRFILEPWGEIYMMAPGSTFIVVAKGPAGSELQVDIADGDVTVSAAWSGSTVILFEDGAGELGAGGFERTRVPPTP